MIAQQAREARQTKESGSERSSGVRFLLFSTFTSCFFVLYRMIATEVNEAKTAMTEEEEPPKGRKTHPTESA